MGETWVDITVDGRKSRHSLASGRTRLGGGGCEVEIAGAQGDELHFWSDPPKVVLVGTATTPLLNGRTFEEAPLEDGDAIQWGSAVLVYGRTASSPVLEELPPEPQTAPGSPQAPGFPRPGGDLARRLQAGLLVDLGLADRQVARRWQEAVQRREFDADACARELLAASDIAADDPRLVERAARLQRDLLMAPIQRGLRGAARSTRTATRSGAAYLVANLIAISIYTLVLLAIMLLVRVQYDFSFDQTLDQMIDMVTPSGD